MLDRRRRAVISRGIFPTAAERPDEIYACGELQRVKIERLQLRL